MIHKNLDTTFTALTSICSINFIAASNITEIFSLLSQGLVAAAAIAKLSWDYVERKKNENK